MIIRTEIFLIPFSSYIMRIIYIMLGIISYLVRSQQTLICLDPVLKSCEIPYIALYFKFQSVWDHLKVLDSHSGKDEEEKKRKVGYKMKSGKENT